MSDNVTPDSTPAGDATPVVHDKPLEPAPKVYDEDYVKSLRQEAAAARIAKKDAVEAAVKELNEKHQAELAARDTAYAELEKQLGDAWVQLQKLHTALEAKVPSDKVLQFSKILQGTDKESIEASARENLELIGGFEKKPVAGFDPTQGFGGKKDIPLNGDPILNAIKGALGIK
ncbi:scaffolding protein [Mycobacterium phage Mulciber]|uniref:head scaffolding protein n=1 Tax=Mycobacterium phage Mulciber TaxID=1805459 RepID=UPI00078D8541|nr:head scaffolding protein [Mycobacterium phage Mulciber]AQT28207.1 scaffolding protein [Mycobacterium phage Jabith]AXC33376.1 scaffolding protein [Mycobacterium phage Ebony]AXC33474.1 scaffolding protein [Mycobacterium phage Joselito]AXH50695.1 scaffolding protein [Mycobacterium phage Snape]QBI98189.1 scaffolding protein [Mycobacterium phage Bowtie]QBI98385.1 scaffolding protein [Mycobacterium phage Munch]QBI98483.1 scaffolding protein [Mycobacterium phage Bud]QGZ16430.1 scaffolding prote